jgi:ABC-type multidrug transport system ATPase subunit
VSAHEGPSSGGEASTSALRLEGVEARDDAGLRGRARGALRGLTLTLPRGLSVLVGTPEDGTLALTLVLAGLTRPRAGRVLIDGVPLGRAAHGRARVAALTADPELPELPEAVALARLVAAARGEPAARGDELLARFGLAALARRRTKSLSHEEARALEAALALSHPAPSLVVAFEPSAELGPLDPELVRSALREQALRAPVLVLTSSVGEASSFGDAWLRLVAGRLACEERATPDGALEVWLREAPLLDARARRASPRSPPPPRTSRAPPRIRPNDRSLMDRPRPRRSPGRRRLACSPRASPTSPT